MRVDEIDTFIGSVAKAKISFTQALERRTVCTDHLGLQQFGSGHEPGIVLAEAGMGTALQHGTSTGMCKMQPLNRESLKRRDRRSLVRGAFEQFLDRDHRDDECPSAQRLEEGPRGADLISRGLALEIDEKGAVEQDRASHAYFRASPSPLPSEASTNSTRSSPVSIGPARSINARITSDFGTFRRRAHRASRAARFLSSFTVIVGMVIH